ncbi:hypothetical protein EWB00_002419 [Schistosoma japonicum]|uniref:Uncharacterized protein n=1 Tax=Schistosoma japonicum TaxID=6182 RepID=A0A4Z2DCJ8_SCHJA|nr:hypothetical protein EWB00_002419 [Schistosoma japonicum]
MILTAACYGRFVRWKRIPGSVWGGKQRKIPLLTNSRKEAFLDELLISHQNHMYLQKPYFTEEVESATLAEEKAHELQMEDRFFYDRYAEQFNRRFPTRNIEAFWDKLYKTKRYDV